MQEELQAIRATVVSAGLCAETQRSFLWRFDQLPNLYRELNRTYESRFADRIAALVAGMVRTLAAKEAGKKARLLGDELVQQLQAVHDRLGIGVELKVTSCQKKAA